MMQTCIMCTSTLSILRYSNNNSAYRTAMFASGTVVAQSAAYLHGGRCMGCDLLVHPVCNAWEHGGATRQHDIAVQVLPDVHITFHDGVEGSVINALSLHAHQAGCEQHLRAPEPFAANSDDLQQSITSCMSNCYTCAQHLYLQKHTAQYSLQCSVWPSEL